LVIVAAQSEGRLEETKMKRLLTSVIAASLLSGLVSVAHADGRDHRRDYDRDRYERHDDRHDRRAWSDHRHDRDRYDRHDRYEHHKRYHGGKYHRPHGYRYHVWRSGDRLPAAYRVSRYYVDDYWTYRLRQPPRGHYWVRVDNDVLLTAIATGVVVQVVSGLFY
jgi:Ni/Co efflux regulator RcnB